MSSDADRARLKVLRPAEASERSVLDRLIEKVTPASLDPRSILRDMTIPEGLQDFLDKRFARYGVALETAEAQDLYTKTRRPYTLARGPELEVGLLHIPNWIVSNANTVGAVLEIQTAFEGHTLRIVSPGCDAPSLALGKMLGAWRQDPRPGKRIAARFIAWSHLKELSEDAFDVAEVFDLELQAAVAGPDPAPPEAEAAERSRVFISYSHRDAEWLDRLKIHLKPLLRQLEEKRPEVGEEPLIWDDSRIEPGDEWRREIREALAAAKVAVLLVSKYFIASDFIDKDELPPILEAAKGKGLRLLWILLDECNWEATRIKEHDAAVKPLQRLDGLEEDDQEVVLKKLSQLIVTYLEE